MSRYDSKREHSETKINIIHAVNGKDAFQKYTENEIDIILMDIKMPKIDGFKTTYKIRQLNRDIPIIAQTAFAMENDRKMSIKAGCSDYIKKPINKENLLELVYSHLR